MKKILRLLLFIAILSLACVPVMAAETESVAPDGGTYYVGVSTKNVTGDYDGYTAVYDAGDTLPEASHGDRFVLGDYEYICTKSSKTPAYWAVTVLDKTKTEYNEILSNINNVPVTVMSYTFNGCNQMIVAPDIPETVTNLTGTFYNCSTLKTSPAIPEGTTTLNRTFMNCTSLKTGPEAIPESVTNMAYTFYGCKNLNTSIVVPTNVTDVAYMLYNSKSLDDVEVNCNPDTYIGFIYRSNVGDITGSTSIREELLATNEIYIVPEDGVYYTGVPSSNAIGDYDGLASTLEAGAALPRVQRLDRFVYGDYEYQCIKSGSTKYWVVKVVDKNKSEYGKILSSINGAPVMSMDYTFSNCTNLVVAPEVPNTVTSMMGTFLNCTALTETGPIPESVTEMRRTFMGCEKLVTTPGTIPSGVTSLIYTFYNCKSLPEAPAIPENVDNIYLTFYNCKKLSQIEVNGNPSHYSKAFYRSGISAITGTTELKAELLRTNGIVLQSAGEVVPEGGTYYVGVTSNTLGDYTGATATYSSGQTMPTEVNEGDAFVLGDYEYRYNYYNDGSEWVQNSEQNAWAARTIDATKSEYGEIQSSINNKDVAILANTFYNCTNLISTPNIPNTITNMDYAFLGCTSLTTVAEIPSNVTAIPYAFYGCSSLTTAPVIPNSVKNITSTFEKCTALNTVEVNAEPTLYEKFAYGSSITEITGTTSIKSELLDSRLFYDGLVCTIGHYKYIYYKELNGWQVVARYTTYTTYNAIKTSINGKKVVSMYQTFANCTNMTTAPEIPDTVTDISYAFANCPALTAAPTISSNVTTMDHAFWGCTSLTTTPTIPENVTSMFGAFRDCTGLIEATDIPSSTTNLGYAFYGCTSLKSMPTISSSVTDLSYTFYDCKMLTDTTEIPSSVTNMSNTFAGCTSLVTAPKIPSGVTNMDKTFRNCTSLTTISSIPNTVKSMAYTFYNCTAMTEAPAIPESVTNVSGTFYGCTNLNSIEVNGDPTIYRLFIKDTNIEEITGSTTMKDELLATK